MKVNRLELEGFGPYLARQDIDFTAFDEDGVFVITGKTGAGKSTVLDAICYALYGTVPRYDGTEKSLRSDFCTDDDRTQVTLEFEVGAARYKVWRSPDYERVKLRGEGTTSKPAEAGLHVWRDGDWQVLEVKPREVGVRVLEIMQLTADQFLQVILLAQGRFSEFLQSKTQERLEVLRSLFGTQRFRDLEAHLKDMEKGALRALERADADLAGIVGRAAVLAATDTPAVGDRGQWLDAQARRLGEAADASRTARRAAAGAAAEAAKTLADAEGLEAKRVKLAQALVTLTELESRNQQTDSDRYRLDLARRAAPVVTPIATSRVARADLEAARGRLGAVLADASASPHATVAWPSGRLAEATVDELRDRMGALASGRGALDPALKLETELDALAAALETTQAELKAHTDHREALQSTLAEAPQQEADLQERLRRAIEAAEKLPGLTTEAAARNEAAAAHRLVTELKQTVEDMRQAEVAASAVRMQTASHHDHMIKRRLRGEAARLALSLGPGQPCPVCGATEHPDPAQPSDNPVSDEDVDTAYEAAESARVALVEATARVRETQQRLADATTRATGNAALAEEMRLRADAALSAAKEAASARVQAQQDLAELAASVERVRGEIGEVSAKIEAVGAAVASRTQALEGAREAVVSARGEFGSVAERAQGIDAAQRALQGVVAAREGEGRAYADAAQAQRGVESAVAESGFASAEEAFAAVLHADALKQLSDAVEVHAQALAGAQAVVAELSSEDLPQEEIDLTALRDASAQAAAARDAAIEAETTASARAKDFEALGDEYEKAAASTERDRSRAMTIRRLAETLQGNEPNERRIRLESFVLAAKLERIVDAANARLVTMSSGQYRLEYDDGAQYRNTQAGLGLKIFDAHTGRSRSTRSLSGGESFLASLALALGLAETVTAEAGGISLSTLFIDEGFGSLDGDTLEVAMSTLDGLRAGGRTVGLISHVDAMKEAIPAKLEVIKAADGASAVRVRAASAR